MIDIVIIMQVAKLLYLLLIFSHPPPVCHHQLTSNKADFSNNQSYQYANIKIQRSISGKPSIFISLNQFTTLKFKSPVRKVSLSPHLH